MAIIPEKYNKRCEIEPLIEEIKNGWGAGAMNSKKYLANSAMFLIKLLSHNLLKRFVEDCVPAVRKWRVEWVRLIIINVPGKLVFSGRQWTLNIPAIPAFSKMPN